MTDRQTGGVDGACPPRRRRRCPRRWNKRRRTLFLTALAETCNVSAAARRAGMDRSSAYDLKDRDVNFARGWGAALERAHGDVELRLLVSSNEGTVRTEMQIDPKTRKPTQIKLVHSYPLTVALRLFLSHREEVAAQRRDEGDALEAREGIIARVNAQLGLVRERLLARARSQAQAQAANIQRLEHDDERDGAP